MNHGPEPLLNLNLNNTSACNTGHLEIGRALRQWMPLFIYATPVTGAAALLLTLGGMMLEGSGVLRGGAMGVFGWLTRGGYFGKTFYLGIGPGIVGEGDRGHMRLHRSC